MSLSSRRALLALLVCVLALQPLTGMVVAAQSPPGAGATERLSAPAMQTGQNGTNATATPGGNASSGSSSGGSPAPVSAAERARIFPVQFDEPYLQVDAQEQGTVYNTSGPIAVFSSSQELETVHIAQQQARAELLEGGHTIVVRYSDDAAPDPRQPSLYKLSLYYPDGSTRQIELYATSTKVSVEAAQLQKYKPLIYQMQDDAEKNGFERSPEGVKAHYESVQEQAEILNNWLSEQAMRAAMTIFSWLTNPFALLITLIAIVLIALFELTRRGWVHDVISNDEGKASRKRERLRLAQKEALQTAAEEDLADVRQIGDIHEICWRDGQGVSTVGQLAELFRKGRTVERGGQRVNLHDGVADLDATTLEESWLEPAFRDGRLPNPETALGEAKVVLKRMNTKYGMGHLYREPYETVCELLDERQELIQEGETTHRSAGAGAAAPGDD